MLLNLLLLVLTSVAAVGGSVNVMENYEEHPDMLDEEEREEFYQYVKKQEEKEKFQNMNNASMNNASMNNASMNNASNVGTESFQAQVANVDPNAPQVNASNVAESFQAQVANVSPQVNANTPTLEGFTGGSFAAF